MTGKKDILTDHERLQELHRNYAKHLFMITANCKKDKHEDDSKVLMLKFIKERLWRFKLWVKFESSYI